MACCRAQELWPQLDRVQKPWSAMERSCTAQFTRCWGLFGILLAPRRVRASCQTSLARRLLLSMASRWIQTHEVHHNHPYAFDVIPGEQALFLSCSPLLWVLFITKRHYAQPNNKRRLQRSAIQLSRPRPAFKTHVVVPSMTSSPLSPHSFVHRCPTRAWCSRTSDVFRLDCRVSLTTGYSRHSIGTT